MDDDELIAAIASGDGDGDDTALRELFSRHAPCLPPDDVEDVLQQIFIAVWQNAKTYQPRGTRHPGRIARTAAKLLRSPGLARALFTSVHLAFAEYALLESWTNPWTWPVRPPADCGAWLCACAVFAVSVVAFTIRGARTRLADDG